MSMVCFELSRELHEQEKAVRGIQIADADSLCNYLKGFWEFIYNHKMFGCVYDIYGDDIEVRRENGFVTPWDSCCGARRHAPLLCLFRI